MLTNRKNPFNILLLLAILAGILLSYQHPALAAKVTKTPKAGGGPSPYDVLAAVNNVRSAHGLAPFSTNGALMSAAQGHSSYMASLDSTSHTGSGGSDPKSRALAAGYGGGSNVSVIENIYGGMGASAQTAVNWWQGDGIHLETMLSTKHTEAGAGVAVGASGVVYFTLDVGVVVGGAVTSGSTGTTGATPGASSAASGQDAPASSGLILATAQPDGSIVHTVEAGQTLWTIAALYKVDINDLLRINGLYTGSLITPGQKITIRQAGEVSQEDAPAATPEAGETRLPSSTPRPVHTLVPTLAAANLVKSDSSAPPQIVAPAALARPAQHSSSMLWIILGLVAAGGVLLLAGSIAGRLRPQ